MKHLLLISILSLIHFGFVNSANASLGFENISSEDLNTINKDFSSTFSYTSVSGASSLGSIFGIEAGVIAGAAVTEGIESLAKEVDPNSEISFLPHAWLVGAITVPGGITIEANFIPELDGGELSFDHLGLGVKWTVTDMIPIPAFPLNLSVKGYFSQTNLSFSQTDSGVTGDVNYENSMYGLLAQGSVSLLVIEPYLGIGWQSSEGKLKSTLSAVFDPSLTTGSSATSEIDGTYFQLGVNVTLLLLRLGFEYQNSFDADRYTAKLSFKF
jgi:hypothetical protein